MLSGPFAILGTVLCLIVFDVTAADVVSGRRDFFGDLALNKT